jgi:hypothetical protein
MPFVLNRLAFGLALMDIDIYRMAKYLKHFEYHGRTSMSTLCLEELRNMTWTRARFTAEYGEPAHPYKQLEYFLKEVEGW